MQTRPNGVMLRRRMMGENVTSNLGPREEALAQRRMELGHLPTVAIRFRFT